MNYLEQSEGVNTRNLPNGSILTVETTYSVYTLVKINDQDYVAEGGKYIRNPVKVKIRKQWINMNERVEIDMPFRKRIHTSPVRNIRVATGTSEYDMGSRDQEGTLGNMV